MNQIQLARILNISASTEGMYEQGRRTPSLDILIMMSKTFHVSLDYLITGSEFDDSVEGRPERRNVKVCQCGCCCCKRYRY